MEGEGRILIKGAGEKASAVAHLIHRHGIRDILMAEKPEPMAERRGVAFCEAVWEGEKTVQGITAVKASLDPKSWKIAWRARCIPIVVDPELEVMNTMKPEVLIDAVMAKKNTGTRMGDAPLVIALGPGFLAGRDAHFVVETDPNSLELGLVASRGEAQPDSKLPSLVNGYGRERLLIAPTDGKLENIKDIGEKVKKGEVVAKVGQMVIESPLEGCVWGIVRGGSLVEKGQKIGDIYPRGESRDCFVITPQAHRIARGVLRVVVSHLSDRKGISKMDHGSI